MRERQTIRGICCGSAGGAVWGCCVCLRCGAFSDAFGSLLVPVGTKSGSKRIFAMVDVNVFPSIYDLFGPSMQIWRSQQSRRVVVTLDDEVMGRGVTVCEVGKSVEKEM
ncbi:uncharacterized protein MONOS_13714 [Monocercomonoides exilis]|uniref:uncharacterized protein n=1 Tax=Monocercomonoides exilis TaxID=2049356 RepID=UPI00355973AA|nr:hypothetical protein MONOS_13714 [Monocercomonoides exilis]|eukprot:MONOS_13714.1-p1 / transcript=MONOS_13714.1 / gene=MONOS_13714 / organism=Monocercomonoides_exilis_PA203 / gene_product=unspecified product / transcript_product=unspecified product / location=Mono_scaffold00870:15881-16207(+) / protein_length=109 / sequence_SO=supercontig / SO=protein_coding / is_pseudo=false